MEDIELVLEKSCEQLKNIYEIKNKLINKYAINDLKQYKQVFEMNLDNEIIKMILDKYEL